jgi:hypothetical protein
LAISSAAQVTIAQISDTHLAEKRAPHATENLLRAVARSTNAVPTPLSFLAITGKIRKPGSERKPS